IEIVGGHQKGHLPQYQLLDNSIISQLTPLTILLTQTGKPIGKTGTLFIETTGPDSAVVVFQG
ncbi:5494_t:CDS:2, partial [Entrophospora sp. SA101]